MSSNLIRDAFISVAIVLAGAMAFNYRAEIYELLGVDPSQLKQQSNESPKLASPQSIQMPETTNLSGSAASIRKGDDGQYWTEARVNSTTIRFLVDTGASVVALTPLDAQKAGIRKSELVYNAPVNTAAGQIMAARIQLDIISVGSVSVSNVRGVVIPEGLSHSLLGMSYLGELQKVEATRSALILRR